MSSSYSLAGFSGLANYSAGGNEPEGQSSSLIDLNLAYSPIRGQMALRGLAAQANKLAELGLRQDLVGMKLDQAYRQFQSSGGDPSSSYLEVFPVVADKVVAALASKATKVAAKLDQVRANSKAAKKLNKKLAKLDSKTARREEKLAPQAEYRVLSKYGLASGPPLTGSRDDPNGLLVIRHGWSQ